MEFLFVINWLLMLSGVLYFVVHLGLSAGIVLCKQAGNRQIPFVSIIVAARNEEKTIGHLLECLLGQTYTNSEIIVINDRSTDRTSDIIDDFKNKYQAIKKINVTRVPPDMPAKKNALRTGIEASKGEILCFTDADCFPPPGWVQELISQFEPQVGMVAGYSPYLIPVEENKKSFAKNLFFKFIGYEELRAAAWSSGAIGWNLGWLCTGRNLAYRRKVYDQVGGFEGIKQSISGDDDLFLQLVRRNTNWKIRYAKSENNFVPTLPPKDFNAFVEQRKRHFSASKIFTFQMMLFFFFYHFANLLLFLSPFLFLFNLISFSLAVESAGIKLCADALLFSFSGNTFKGSIYKGSFIFYEGLYVLYNSLIGPLGIFKKFEWKQTPSV